MDSRRNTPSATFRTKFWRMSNPVYNRFTLERNNFLLTHKSIALFSVHDSVRELCKKNILLFSVPSLGNSCKLPETVPGGAGQNWMFQGYIMPWFHSHTCHSFCFWCGGKVWVLWNKFAPFSNFALPYFPLLIFVTFITKQWYSQVNHQVQFD